MWIIVATLGYFLGAVTNILDKFILSSRIPNPSVYAFFAAMFSISTFVLAPFGLTFIEARPMAESLLSGALFTYGLLFFYKAVKMSEVSRVAPLVGSLTAVGTLAAVIAVSAATLDYASIMSFWLLVGGGFLMAFDLPLKPRIMFQGIRTIVIASFLLGASLVILKDVYTSDGFINGYVWSRLGAFLAGFTLFLVPTWRREIIGNLRKPAASRSESARTGVWFMVNKSSGAASAFLVNYAVSLGSLSIVHALAGIQYAFVFLLIIALSRFRSGFVQERLALNDWVQKFVALACIGVGLYYASISATMTL